jgi:hypothetical protein
MKKALVVLLILAVAGGLFAQTLSKTITADYETDLLYVSSDHTGDQKANLLTTSAFDSTELRLRIDYKGDYFTSYVILKADSLISRARGTPTAPGDGSFSNESARPIDLFYQTFNEYNLTGTVGMWKASIGNAGERGVVDNFSSVFDGFLTLKHDQYGIFALTKVSLEDPQPPESAFPANKTGYSARSSSVTTASWDVRNFANDAPHGYKTKPWFGIYADLKDYVPITVAVAGSLNDPKENKPGDNVEPDFYHKANAAIRVSGTKIADLVSFDVIYKYWSYGGQSVTQTVNGLSSVEDASTHTFGLYANLFVLDGLGIGVGYSGAFMTLEDGGDREFYNDSTKTAKRSAPFFNGIDLRVQYSLAPFTFTLNNNISFASAEGSKNDIVYGFIDTSNRRDALNNPIPPGLTEKESESYFGLYNALAVAYKVTDTLTVKFLLGNELISYSYENSTDKAMIASVDILFDKLQTALMASFVVHPNVTFRAGLDLINTYRTVDGSTKADGFSWETTKYGTLEFGIPIGVKIVF